MKPISPLLPATLATACAESGLSTMPTRAMTAVCAPWGAAGDLGFTVGVATVRRGAHSSCSNYLTVWKRLRTGEWRFVAGGGNAAPTR